MTFDFKDVTEIISGLVCGDIVNAAKKAFE